MKTLHCRSFTAETSPCSLESLLRTLLFAADKIQIYSNLNIAIKLITLFDSELLTQKVLSELRDVPLEHHRNVIGLWSFSGFWEGFSEDPSECSKDAFRLSVVCIPPNIFMNLQELPRIFRESWEDSVNLIQWSWFTSRNSAERMHYWRFAGDSLETHSRFSEDQMKIHWRFSHSSTVREDCVALLLLASRSW